MGIREVKLVLEPSINIPLSRGWFWSDKVQDKIQKAAKHFKEGECWKYDGDEIIKELDKRD